MSPVDHKRREGDVGEECASQLFLLVGDVLIRDEKAKSTWQG